ncbi:hypothetical protein ECC02_008263 [Trypanosoma cruzi]|uniref:Uncharacterized protein n=1 Tax=Trypanosoma cruzi TaxID=5693 RepID=A0A7J6XX19_TRYCR|nr:hypothetical protein ECC02_008263 [Trypanosoma cruzi]
MDATPAAASTASTSHTIKHSASPPRDAGPQKNNMWAQRLNHSSQKHGASNKPASHPIVWARQSRKAHTLMPAIQSPRAVHHSVSCVSMCEFQTMQNKNKKCIGDAQWSERNTYITAILRLQHGIVAAQAAVAAVLAHLQRSQRVQHNVCMFTYACVHVSAYTCRAAMPQKRIQREQRAEREGQHTRKLLISSETHAAGGMVVLNHNKSKTIKKQKAEAWDDQRTHSHCSRKAKHTHRERERGRPLNAMKTKQKQLRCSAHAVRQDGSGACRAKESTNGPAWVCMHIYNGHIMCVLRGMR